MKKTAFLSLFLAFVLILGSTALAVDIGPTDPLPSPLPVSPNELTLTGGTFNDIDLSGATNLIIRVRTPDNVTINKLTTPDNLILTIVGNGKLTINEWIMGDNTTIKVPNQEPGNPLNIPVTVKKLTTPSNLSSLTINSSKNASGDNKLTINKWDIGDLNVDFGKISINNVNFYSPNDELFTSSWVWPTLSAPVDFTDCTFTGDVCLRWPNVYGNFPINITNCAFIGTDGSGIPGFNEMINFAAEGPVNITSGSLKNGYILANGGNWNISGVKFDASAVRIGAVNDAQIIDNTFTNGVNDYVKYGIGFEMRYGFNKIGTVTISENKFWVNEAGGGVAIAYRENGGDRPLQPSANNLGSIKITADNDFTGATFGFKDLWGGSDKSKLTIADDNLNRPAGRDYYEFFDLVKPVVATTPSSSGIHWYPPDPKSSPAPTNDVPYAAVTGIGTGETRAKIPVYISSKLSGKKAGTLAKGDEFNILAVLGKAARIETDGYEGYVALSKINAAFSAHPLAMTTRKATVYEEPSAKSKYKIGTIAKNTEITVIAWAGAWAQIRFENADGEEVEAWIQVKDIKFVV